MEAASVCRQQQPWEEERPWDRLTVQQLSEQEWPRERLDLQLQQLVDQMWVPVVQALAPPRPTLSLAVLCVFQTRP